MSKAAIPTQAPPDTELLSCLAGAWRSGHPLPTAQAAALAPGSVAEAYQVQKALGKKLGWWPDQRPKAWKLTTGLPPKVAPVPDAFILKAEDSMGCYRPYSLCGIEVELGYRLASPIRPHMSAAEVQAAIGETLVLVEIFDVRAQRWHELPETFLLADMQMHGRLILGSGVAGYATSPKLEIYCEDLSDETLSFNQPIDDLLRTLPWLAEHAEQHGWSLEAGDLIASGSWCGLLQPDLKSSLAARFDGIGAVNINLATLIED